jgi:S-adenosyl-L-methionine hydrolase (adenosine-forming)
LIAAPVITFLSDYGLEDEFVGVCHGVIASVCPQARVIDLIHGVPRHDVRAGALILRASLAYLPVGVHLAVVDPGVGSARRAVALRTGDGRAFVGPDNGLLMPAADAGGVVEAFDIGRSRYRLEPVSATFHGRDVFAPVAAHLAAGVPLAAVGEPLDSAGLVTLELPQARAEGGLLVAHALQVDRFGNVALDAGQEQARAAGVEPGRQVEIELDSGAGHRAQVARTFADVDADELLVYVDAHGRLALAMGQGDAAGSLGITVDATVRIRPA